MAHAVASPLQQEQPMNSFAATRLLVVFAWCALSALPAQQATPRFVLPDVPYDYAPLAAPGLAAHFSLPGRNGIIMRGCCGGPAPGPSTPPPPPDRTNELATLGRVLFHDPLLSRNQTRSCASCHQQARAFADGQAHSRGFGGHPTRRNSMSIANLGLHDHGFFWDARAETLEQMVVMPIKDPIEMGMDLPGVLERLQAEPGYAELFAHAFGDPKIDEQRLAEALAQFVRSIVSLRSRYDEGLAATGDVDKDFPNFTAAENHGKRLFFGEPTARERSCAGCHVDNWHNCCGMEITPVSLQSDVCRNNGLDVGRPTDDPGLGRVTGKAEDRGKFRAPSLRNVELTGPYMHDGRFQTLEQVVQFYSNRVLAHPNLDQVLRNDAGKQGWGQAAGTPAPVDLTMGAAQPQRLGVPMSSRERADLVSFLKTLTDWELVRDPRFSDPFVRPRAP
jgi:cytochrome c peroxidase